MNRFLDGIVVRYTTDAARVFRDGKPALSEVGENVVGRNLSNAQPAKLVAVLAEDKGVPALEVLQ
jgi:hypothetical protein